MESASQLSGGHVRMAIRARHDRRRGGPDLSTSPSDRSPNAAAPLHGHAPCGHHVYSDAWRNRTCGRGRCGRDLARGAGPRGEPYASAGMDGHARDGGSPLVRSACLASKEAHGRVHAISGHHGVTDDVEGHSDETRIPCHRKLL